MIEGWLGSYKKSFSYAQWLIMVCVVYVLFTAHCLTNFGAKFFSIREVLDVLFLPCLHLVQACYCFAVSEETA